MLDWRHARSLRFLATNRGGRAPEPRLLTLPLEPAETRSSPGRVCVCELGGRRPACSIAGAGEVGM